MTPLWIFELYILATIVCDARGVRRGIIKQTTETHCLIGVWLFLVDLPCVCEPVRGLSAPQLWLSRSPTTLQPYYVILIFEIKSQILKTVFSQAFSNVASVCGPSSSPSVLDDGGNPCFDPAAKTSALKMSFFFFFLQFWFSRYLAHWAELDSLWMLVHFLLYTCLLPQLRPQREAW